MSSGSFISSTVGASLVASILQTYLFGVLTFQYATYYSSGFKDPKWITYPMGLIFLMTAFHCLSLLYMTWYYSIENYGNPESLLRPKIWPFPLSAIMTTLTAYVTQLFLTYRAYRLTQNFFLVIPLVLVSTAAMVLGIIQGAMVWMLSSIEELSTLNATLTAWLTLEVAADWLIAGVLLWAIRASRTTYRRSGRVVKRLFRTAVQTGKPHRLYILSVALTTSVLRAYRECICQRHNDLVFGVPEHRVRSHHRRTNRLRICWCTSPRIWGLMRGTHCQRRP
ncbi:hypothetical protein CC2G_009681 [Coprinopsis cinerea AmutBmut pab1-1]|nr:hypothetical protein CC2G_009681 [Coprinopsis cinerea AmutBmut pab1-1]